MTKEHLVTFTALVASNIRFSKRDGDGKSDARDPKSKGSAKLRVSNKFFSCRESVNEPLNNQGSFDWSQDVQISIRDV